MIATYEIEISGRIRRVAVERVGAAADRRYRVTVGGSVRTVDARPAGQGRWSLLFPEEGAASYDVAIAEGQSGELHIHLPDGPVRAIVNGRRTRRDGPSDSGSGEQRLAAPMPGRIVRVLVKPGDEVRARQPLVIVEAMKMENELSLPRPGRVKDVQVRDGMSVEAGRLLVLIE